MQCLCVAPGTPTEREVARRGTSAYERQQIIMQRACMAENSTKFLLKTGICRLRVKTVLSIETLPPQCTLRGLQQ